MNIVQLEFDLFQKSDVELLSERMDALELSHNKVRKGMFRRLGELTKLNEQLNKVCEEIRLGLEALGEDE